MGLTYTERQIAPFRGRLGKIFLKLGCMADKNFFLGGGDIRNVNGGAR